MSTYPAHIIDQSSTAAVPLSREVARLRDLWSTQYGLARRHDNPLAALIVATLSTAEMWGKIK